MGCSSCGSKGSSFQGKKKKASTSLKAPIVDDCEYDLEMMQSWLSKIECFKINSFYVSIPNMNVRMIRRFEGVVKSAINNKDNICYYRERLIEIESFITLIMSTGLCLN